MRYDLSSRELRVRDYYRIGWEVLKREKNRFLILLLVVGLPSTILESWLYVRWDVNPAGFENSGYSMLIMIITQVFMVFASACVYVVTENDLEERSISFGTVLARIVRRFPMFVLALLLYYAVVMLGFLMLVIPAFYFIIVFSFYLLFMVLEDKDFWDGFGGSRRLVRGHFWHVTGMTLAFLLPGFVVFLIVFFWPEARLANGIVSFLSHAYTMFYSILLTLLFLNVRQVWKPAAPVSENPEGAATGQLPPETPVS